MVRRPPRVVVVGAGVAGLTTASRLAAAGYRTTLLERASQPGGRAAQLVHKGFRFDLGPTLLFMPDVFRSAFAECGADFDREVPLRRLRPNYRLHFQDGRTLTLSSVLGETMASLESFQPGSSRGLLRYLAGAASAYEISRQHFVGTRIRSLAQFVKPATLRALVQSGAFRSLRRAAKGAFASDELAGALSFQSMYLGMSPFASPDLYRLLFFTELGEGIFYPHGGIGTLVRALERVALRNGVRIVYGAEVTSVEKRSDGVSGVFAADERYACDAVVFTADLPYVYNHILDETAHRSTRMRLTPSALLLYAAVDLRYPVHHHEFLMPRDLQETCRDIFERGVFPADPAIYVSAPSATDPTMAPAGKEALYVLVPVPNLHGRIDWSEQTEELTQRTLAQIEARLMPGLRLRIQWCRTRTPKTFECDLNLFRGSAFGLSHDVLQIGPLRPNNRHARLSNVYFAGASTRPATGLPLVTLGALQTAERIREEIPV